MLMVRPQKHAVKVVTVTTDANSNYRSVTGQY